ncbi:fused MFS/spermidine synthase [Caenimonas sedimenti]|uniref:fused MFS/spermidine synthase n=1 Tax=Caenimonas sedimenti TaxID=2596921 RepID=UPI0016470301|nr:fused MFS/spermidine synthase [Caenimonas sedimenti]
MQPAVPGPSALRTSPAADTLLLLGFFVSGASALIYQVGWQRALYGYIGVDIDSITIIVSVFMLGIGVGGMLGGWLADTFPRQRLRLYALIELSIGAYGLASLAFLPWLVDTLAPASSGAGASVAACFVFLLAPTILMGMTLPLLTMAFDERRANIGVSVGTLYFINTLGAATGAGLVPFYLFPMWELPQVVTAAAVGNFMVIACTLLAARLVRAGTGP